MSVYIEYPADWIGVPAFGEGEIFATPADWAGALTEELIAEAGVDPSAEARASLVHALTMLGTGTRERGASASYIHYPRWGASPELVDALLIERATVGDAPAHEVAGSLEPDLLGPPTIIDIETAKGVRGCLVLRHAPMDEESPHVVTIRASCALDVGDDFLVLGTASTDLAGFEAFRPFFLELIESVTVSAD